MMRVFHLNEEAFGRVCSRPFLTPQAQAKQAAQDWRDGNYRLVARVVGDDLHQAHRLTNSIDQPWHQNRESVIPCFEGEAYRSTSVGDVLELEGAGDLWVVCTFGFEQFTR